VPGRREDSAGKEVAIFHVVEQKGPRRPGKLVGVGLSWYLKVRYREQAKSLGAVVTALKNIDNSIREIHDNVNLSKLYTTRDIAMEEQVFFDNGDVTVTNARFISSGQTYVMSNITSVKSLVEDPSKTGPVVFIVIGGIMALAGLGNASFGAILTGAIIVAIGILWFKGLKSKFYVALATASGETRALSSEDKSFIDTIVKALNDAIVHRG